MVLICISQMANNIEHLFLLTSHLYILFGKCIFRSSTVCFFLIGKVFLLLSCESSLHILDKGPSSNIRFANISYHFCKLSFHFFMICHKTLEFLIFMKFKLSIFAFIFLCFGGSYLRWPHCLIQDCEFLYFCLFLRDLSF